MRSATLILFSILLVPGLAGCSENSEQAKEIRRSHAIEQPEWEIGQWWSYREDNDGWYNQTVVRLEEKHGFEVYLLEEEFTETEDGRVSGKSWRDVDTLGVVAFGGGIPVWWDCPMSPMYPIENTDWRVCTMRTNQGVEGRVTVRLVVGNWTSLDVPAGTFEAVELTVEGREGNETGVFARLWYSPAVESFVRLEEPGWYTRELYDWGTNSGAA